MYFGCSKNGFGWRITNLPWAALAPPDLSSLAIVARMWAKTRNRFIIAGELRKANFQVQGDERPESRVELLFPMHRYIYRGQVKSSEM